MRFEMLYCSMDLGPTRDFELKMNGNTADLYRMPLPDGGGTVCRDFSSGPRTGLF